MFVKIRPMDFSDIDRVYAIEVSSHRAPWSRDILSDCVLVGYDCRVIELTTNAHKQLAGYTICRKSQNVCHILNLCVATSEQGKGYGKLLLKSILETLNNTCFDTVVLEVRPSNVAAMKLYEQFGFQQDLIKKGYYVDKHGEEDAILLKKTLPAS